MDFNPIPTVENFVFEYNTVLIKTTYFLHSDIRYPIFGQ
ncbi:MAG: hypothetical protein KatS3mg083_598 [Candidatus Dojkabacteria bacterium]|nr:MAG: hypothetical protein KatS3mg083_598 [Candidatus Dojkabacteria bacterium]